MKKKTKIIAAIAAACLLAVLFVPFDVIMYDDGGSVEYRALSYKLVFWDFFDTVYGDDGKIARIEKTEKTSFYFFPLNLQDIDELKDREFKKGETP